MVKKPGTVPEKKFSERLDDRLRFGDLHRNRTAGGWLKAVGIDRHTLGVLVLPSLLSAALVIGAPTLGPRLWYGAATAAGVSIILTLVGRWSAQRNKPLWTDLVAQAALLATIGAAVWTVGPNTFQEAGVYRHVLIPLVVVVILPVLLASLLARGLFSSLREGSRYGEYLRKTELFAHREETTPWSIGSFFRSLLTVAFRAPLHLLWPPAFVSLLLPPDVLYLGTVIAFVVSYLVLLLAGQDQRLDKSWKLLFSRLFRGGGLLVSLIVFLVSGLRLYGSAYVTTIFDTGEGLVITSYLVIAYVVSWWYDYWVNRLLAQQLLCLIDKAAYSQAMIEYPIDQPGTSVPPDQRKLQIHGSSRFVVVRPAEPYTFFHAYSMAELFQELSAEGAPGGGAQPSTLEIKARILDYHGLVATVVVLLAVLGSLWIHFGEQDPELIAAKKSTVGVRLAALLFDEARCRADRPTIVIAGSGGGTRAALYTAAILEGLAQRGYAPDIIAGSGVSGGGATLACFAGRRSSFLNGQGNHKAWGGLFETMKEPFIQDVLNRASEWRIVSRGRLGLLLAESFQRRWTLPGDRNQLGEVRDFGLILNTALAGYFEAPTQNERLPLVNLEQKYRNATRSDLAGGRLVLTNLLLSDRLVPSKLEPQGTVKAPVIVSDPEARLETAAALNANFPPVFSNAAVDVDNRVRYWVTDGGAADNRGIEMLLYAVREALVDAEGRQGCGGRLPLLHVIVADASAYSGAYTQNRGLGTAMGARSEYASLLAAELKQSIEETYRHAKQPGDFKVHYVPMPLRLRESGSFGTHWMLQPWIEVRRDERDRIPPVTLKGEEMVALLRALHAPKDNPEPSSPSAKAVLGWARDDKWLGPWEGVLSSLAPSAPRGR